MSHLQELLALFREQEPRRMHTITVMINNDDLKTIASAWTSIHVRWKAHPSKQPDASDEGALWEWLWKGVDYSEVDLGIAAAIARARVSVLVKTLILNRLIYPDGTIARPAMNVLGGEVNRFAVKAGVKPGEHRGDSRTAEAKPTQQK